RIRYYAQGFPEGFLNCIPIHGPGTGDKMRSRARAHGGTRVVTSQLCKGAGMSGASGRAALALFVLALSLGTALQPVSASSPPEVRWFWVQRASGWTNIRTVVVASTRHLTVYAPAHTVTDHDASRIATTFERRTYWKDTQLFG